MKNTGYRVDFTTKTFTMTRAFEADLMNGEAQAVGTLARFQAMFPDLKIVHKTRRPSKYVNPDKGLTYACMEKYIGFYENAEELLEIFQKVKGIAATQKNSYLYTKTWFMEQFPNFNGQPEFRKGKLYVLPKQPREITDQSETQEDNNKAS